MLVVLILIIKHVVMKRLNGVQLHELGKYDKKQRDFIINQLKI